MCDRPERICFHVPYDLVPIVKAIAEHESTPACKWLGQIIRLEVSRQRKQLLTVDLDKLEALNEK